MMENDFRFLEEGTNREIILKGESFLFFGGTAYLGLQNSPKFIQLYIDGVKKYGVNNGTSRGNNVQLAIYPEAERFASNYFDSESALVVSSGFIAAQLVVQHFSAFGEVLYAPDSHPALWQNNQPEKQTNSFKGWMSQTVDYINQSAESNFVIISNTLNALIPEEYDFSALLLLSTHKNVILIVDDSHGIGVLGKDGKGLWSTLPQSKSIHPILVASMAKAYGLDGGLILADASIIQQLKQTSMFMGASPPSPAAMYAFINSAPLFEQAFSILKINTKFFEQNPILEFTSIQSLPVYLSNNQELVEHLLKHHIVISSFRYPKPTDPLMNRIVLTAAHHKEDILALQNAMKSF